MAPDVAWLPRSLGIQFTNPDYQKSRSRPQPLRVRTYSVAGHRSVGFDENRDGVFPRNKSLSGAAHLSDWSLSIADRSMEERDNGGDGGDLSAIQTARSSLDSAADRTDYSSLIGSPGTAATGISSERSSLDMEGADPMIYDFSKVDYELENARVLGEGLWSKVYLAEPKTNPVHGHRRNTSSLSSPRSLRKPRSVSTPTLFAVKTPLRREANNVFQQEARVLTHLQRQTHCSDHIVPFLGLDKRTQSLVFTAVVSGSLENLTSRLKQMPEVGRHLEVISTFPTIAYDLIRGLDFLHTHDVVHADIKPANILLDVITPAVGSDTTDIPLVRARYIDFSASFIPSHPDPSLSSSANAGGTWTYLAPEQLRRPVPAPTPASDVWSLGVTLLYILIGDSPYEAATQGNAFMLREAVKSGDPLQFARMDPVAQKRLAAAQDLVDCCRQALKKDPGVRVTAAAWVSWLEEAGK